MERERLWRNANPPSSSAPSLLFSVFIKHGMKRVDMLLLHHKYIVLFLPVCLFVLVRDATEGNICPPRAVFPWHSPALSEGSAGFLRWRSLYRRGKKENSERNKSPFITFCLSCACARRLVLVGPPLWVVASRIRRPADSCTQVCCRAAFLKLAAFYVAEDMVPIELPGLPNCPECFNSWIFTGRRGGFVFR